MEEIIMNKDEILEKSRRENSKKDPYEMEIDLKSSNLGMVCSIVLCLVLFLVQRIAGGVFNYGFWSIIMAENAGAFIYKGIKLHNRSNMIMGAVWCFCALAGAVASVLSMF